MRQFLTMPDGSPKGLLRCCTELAAEITAGLAEEDTSCLQMLSLAAGALSVSAAARSATKRGMHDKAEMATALGQLQFNKLIELARSSGVLRPPVEAN
jgi:hypothetical protein